MSRAILWSRENFTSSNPYLQKGLLLSALQGSPKVSSFTRENELFKKEDEKMPTAAEVIRKPVEGLEATGDVETMVYDMATTAEDLSSLGFVVMESSKEREINYHHTGHTQQQHSTATLVKSEIRVQRRAPKRKRETDSEDGSTKRGVSKTSKKSLLSNKDDSITKIVDLATISETLISNKNAITKTRDLATSPTKSNTKDYVTEDTITSIETVLSCNAEDFFWNPEDFLSNTEELFSNTEDLLSGMDDLATSPEDFSPDLETCQLDLVKEQCKVFDKLMEENRLLTQELMNLSTLPRTRDTVAQISTGLKMIAELSRKMRNCTASSLLNLTHVLLPDVS